MAVRYMLRVIVAISERDECEDPQITDIDVTLED